MPLFIYDTRRRRKVLFQPLEPGIVKMYTCGPTVWDDAHIGNMRAYVFEDILRRTLKYLGFRVVQVMNITDVEDKTIRAAREKQVALSAITDPVKARFFEDIDRLNIEHAEHYPAATDHVEDMIRMVQTLLDKGYAYQAGGSVYYRIDRFSGYGSLSGMKLQQLERGVRIDADEYEKDNFRDFALWKGWSEEDGDVWWDSPFGRGRPGWHIECSVMSMVYLGEEFDIHTGGVDNIFPHHENEIAQSVAATGKSFAKYWMHNEHLLVDGRKMSKSLGNFYTLRQLLDEGHPPRALRYVLSSTHYRQQLNFTADAAKAAAGALERLDTIYHAAVTAEGEGGVRTELMGAMTNAQSLVVSSMEDDLGVPAALAALFDLVSELHRMIRMATLNAAEGAAVKGFWREMDRLFGFMIPPGSMLPEPVRYLVTSRLAARRKRDFAEADRIRDNLDSRGYQLEDTQRGTVVIWKSGRELVEGDEKRKTT